MSPLCYRRTPIMGVYVAREKVACKPKINRATARHATQSLRFGPAKSRPRQDAMASSLARVCDPRRAMCLSQLPRSALWERPSRPANFGMCLTALAAQSHRGPRQGDPVPSPARSTRSDLKWRRVRDATCLPSVSPWHDGRLIGHGPGYGNPGFVVPPFKVNVQFGCRRRV